MLRLQNTIAKLVLGIRVICREETHIRSRIPRRRCLTRIAWQQDVISDVGQVGTAGSGQDQIIVN